MVMERLMTDYDIHSCGYYCDRPACIKAQRDELRQKLFSDQAVKTYSGGKPNYTQPIEQEPVAYIDVETRNLSWAKPTRWETPTVVKMDKVPLYTKKEWVGLTKEELAEISEFHFHGALSGREFYDDIEAKLKEKNSG
jgi:hypothetical protein